MEPIATVSLSATCRSLLSIEENVEIVLTRYYLQCLFYIHSLPWEATICFRHCQTVKKDDSLAPEYTYIAMDGQILTSQINEVARENFIRL